MTAATTRAIAEPRARFRDLLAAEWRKLWSLRSTPWSMLIGALAVIAFNVGAAYDHYRYWDARTNRGDLIADGIPLLYAFNTNAGMIMMVATGTLGALAITGEHTTGLIRTTFAAVPARRPVMAAKMCVITATMTTFGFVASVSSFGLTQAILSGRDAGVSIGHPGALRVVMASALLAPLSALVGAAIGAIVRHGAAAVVSTVLVLGLLPLFLSEDRHWSAVLAHMLPWHAWLRLVDVTYDPGRVAYPWTVTGAWIVFAVWALATTVLALVAVHRRDV